MRISRTLPAAIILLGLIQTTVFSQAFAERTLATTITAVTVFPGSAQVYQTGETYVPAGEHTLVVRGLSPYIDDRSIQVNATGDFTILSVNHKYDYLSELKQSRKIDSLKFVLETLEADMASDMARADVLKEKRSFLEANRNLGGAQNNVSIDQLEAMLSFYEREITGIREEETRINRRLGEMRTGKQKLEQQLKVLNKELLPSALVEIRVKSDHATAATFTVTYLVRNAGWFPRYDIRVKDVASPLLLTYQAEVHQKTGVDWNNVRLRFSSADPEQTGVMPELQTWRLDYARNTHVIGVQRDASGLLAHGLSYVRGIVTDDSGEPIVGANVRVRNSTVGTSTGLQGEFSLVLPLDATHLTVNYVGYSTQEIAIKDVFIHVKLKEGIVLSERLLSGPAIGAVVRAGTSKAQRPVTTVIENQTAFEFEVEMPYTVRSASEPLNVDLSDYSIEAEYEYYAVPRKDKDAFLIARMTEWDQYNLLDGVANLYFEDAFVGRTVINARSLSDTLEISLGRDKSIVVGRVKSAQYKRNRFIGTSSVESRSFDILARNRKSQVIRLTIIDQIPVPVINAISVNPVTLSGGTLDEESGLIRWTFDLAPQQQVEFAMQYEVRYPRSERVLLE